MNEKFIEWWMKKGGSKLWAEAIEVDILKAIEMVFESGRDVGSIEGYLQAEKDEKTVP